MRKIVVPNSFLAEVAELLRQGQTVKLHIDGQSMYPFIRGGDDIVEVEPYEVEDDLPLWCCPFYQWDNQYMIHRYVGREKDKYQMLGDGNIARVEQVEPQEIIGLLRYIYRSDGTIQDCRDERWLKQGKWWYHLRFFRRWLIPMMKKLRFKGIR